MQGDQGGLSDKMTFEKKQEASKRVIHVGTWEYSVQAEELSIIITNTLTLV